MVHGEEDRAGQLVRREELDLVLAKDFNDYGLVGKAICTGTMSGQQPLPERTGAPNFDTRNAWRFLGNEQRPAKEDEDEAYGFGDNSPSQSDGSGGLWSYGSDEADDAGAPQSIQGSEPVNPVYVEEGSAEGASGDFESDVLHSLAKAQNEEGHQACCCRSSACHCLSCMAICWRSTTCACLSCRITCWSNSACACSSSWRSTACAY
eukprot:jgi/Tetstr1/464766/TSEL_009512.t1